MKQWQAVSIGQLQHQLVTGSKLFCCQSWVSHVGYFHEGTASASARRLSITAIGVMARSTLTSLYSLLPPKGEKDPPHRPTTRQQQGRRGGNKLSLHDMTGQSWVSHVGPSFFCFGLQSSWCSHTPPFRGAEHIYSRSWYQARYWLSGFCHRANMQRVSRSRGERY